MSLNLDKTNLVNDILIITNDDGSIQCIPRDGATSDELVLFAEFETAYPDGKVTAVSLEEAKIAKTKEIVNAYNTALTTGFNSTINGVLQSFDYTESSQLKFMKLIMVMEAGLLTLPTTVFTKDGTPILLAQDQFQDFLKDLVDFEMELETKLHTYIGEINSAITVSAVNTIVWSW